MPQYEFLPEGILINTEKNRKSLESIEAMERAAAEGLILEAPAVMCDAEHNLTVDLGGGIRGIIPRCQAALGIETGATREIAVISRVGHPVCFKITGFCGNGAQKNVILSRSAAQQQALEYFMSNLRRGDLIKARVTHLEPFGAFVDIGCGIISLIGIENISVSRICHPSDRFAVGQDIFAVVSEINHEDRRISLTHKELLGTWEQNAALFCAGETVRGIIRDTPDYGIFVELAPNLSGLAEKRDDLRHGQQVSVYIKSILPERMKIKLIVIDSIAERAERAPLKYYLPDGGHIDSFTYSPACCTSKLIRTVF